MDPRQEDQETPSTSSRPITDPAHISLDNHHAADDEYETAAPLPLDGRPLTEEELYLLDTPADEPYFGNNGLDIEAVDEGPNSPGAGEIAKALIREVVETVVLTLVIFFLIQLVIRNFRVDGHSMDPNLHHGQYLVVDKISYRLPLDFRPPARGDVIVFAPPTQPDKDFVKRIIALPGETIEIRQGQVFINGEALDESYLPNLDRYSMSARTVAPGEYFVMGDNRGNSNDSRNWGTLTGDKIVGKAWVSYWPPETWGTIPKDRPTDNTTLFHALSELVPAQ